MPKFRKVKSLMHFASDAVAKKLHSTLLHLDSIWTPPPLISPGSTPSSSPTNSPISPSRSHILPPVQMDLGNDDKIDDLRQWLFQLPLHLVEEVIRIVLCRVEAMVHEDKDCKLILTLINIERTKPSDFFFGVHSLFRTLASTSITKLPFSTKTWFCIWEFEQLTTCDYLQTVMVDSFPRLSELSQVNMAYIASDKLMYLLARYCQKLEELNVDNCHKITEKGIRFLAGKNHSLPLESFGQTGCKNLRVLSLQGCTSVTDQAIWYALTHLKKLQFLRYHQSYSVAEILCNEIRKCEERNLPELALQTFDHPFPYGLNIPENEIKRVTRVCSNVKVLNLVSLDNSLPAFANFRHITKATIEMEDAFGMGLFNFLRICGPSLREFTISCGSDADSTFLDGGGRAFQLFNVGLKLARRFCPELRLLSISGCGLVTNDLLDHFEREHIRNRQAERNHRLTKLKTLILLTYYDADETPIQTCEEYLLFKTLTECPDIECLSLEGNFSNFLNDEFFNQVMAKNDLRNLRIFDIQGTPVPLTILTAKRFLTLPNLQELRVSCWRLSEQEYKNLDDTVRMSGWDFRLSRRSTSQHF